MVGVRTAARAYLDYGMETTFGTAVTKTRVLGLEEKVTNLRVSNNQVALQDLGQNYPEKFGHGKTDIQIGIDYVLSNPWAFELFFPKHTKTDDVGGTVGLNEHKLELDKEPKTANIELGAELSTNSILFDMLGVVGEQMRISTSIDANVDCNLSLRCGKIGALNGAVNDTPPTDGFPFYRFSHADIEIPDGTRVASVQSLNLTINQNGKLEYELNENDAVGAHTGVFVCNGALNLFIKDRTFFQKVLDREEYANASFVFSNKASGNSERSIELKATGVGLSENALQGAQNVQDLKQNISFQCRKLEVIAKNAATALP